MEIDARLQNIFTSLLIYLFISKAIRKERPLWKQKPIPEPYLTYLSWSQVKEPSGPPPGVLSERYASFLEPSFIHHSRSPVYEPPSPDSRFSSDVKWPLWREMPVCRAFLNTSSRAPIKETFPEALRSEPLQREMSDS